MNSKVRKIILAILVLVFLVSGGMLLRNTLSAAEGRETYDEARELAGISSDKSEKPKTTPAPTAGSEIAGPEASAEPRLELDESTAHLADIDLDALREVNPDIIGWIEIPGSPVSYPIMQGSDNNFYLDHSWKGESNVSGSIYMDYRSSADFSDFHSIVYGHRMADGSMFAFLTKYSKQSHLEENPYVYVVTDAGVSRYAIFSSYETATGGGHSYRLGLETDEDRQVLIDYFKKKSDIESDISPAPDDEILTLSTCVAAASAVGTRWVVHAVHDLST